MDFAEAVKANAIASSIQEGLAKCTDEQRAFFYRIWPGAIPKSELDNAHDLVARTVRRNEER